MIPYGRHNISQSDVDAVVDVLRSDFLTQRAVLPRFETAVAEYCGAAQGVAVNSATSALHVACLALELGSGDWLWTSPNTFVASANAALYCGAKVDFVDIDPKTYNMCPIKLEQKLKLAEKNGKLPKIVIPVHYGGQPCDMAAIHVLSRKYGFRIIEDASHAIGSSYNGAKIGSCLDSDITVFSFHPVKIITSGEGGMAMTQSAELGRRMRLLRAHGITSESALFDARPNNEIWNYQQIELGYNYRMTDIHAALGLSQLTQLDQFIGQRHKIASSYATELQSLPIILPYQACGTHSSYHLYPIRVNQPMSGRTQQQVYDWFWQNGISVNLHYIPVHRHPYYKKLGFELGDFPAAEQMHREVISLPIYAGLSDSDQTKVIKLTHDILS